MDVLKAEALWIGMTDPKRNGEVGFFGGGGGMGVHSQGGE